MNGGWSRSRWFRSVYSPIPQSASPFLHWITPSSLPPRLPFFSSATCLQSHQWLLHRGENYSNGMLLLVVTTKIDGWQFYDVFIQLLLSARGKGLRSAKDIKITFLCTTKMILTPCSGFSFKLKIQHNREKCMMSKHSYTWEIFSGCKKLLAPVLVKTLCGRQKDLRNHYAQSSPDDKVVTAGSSNTDSEAVSGPSTDGDSTTKPSPLTSDSPANKTSADGDAPLPKRSPVTAREKLRAARVLSRFTDTPVSSKTDMGKKVLDALRDSDKGKSRSGLPQAPTNLFDDSKRGMPKQGLTFDFPGGSDLFIIVFSFVFISTIMFATTYVVWKAGAIHFNEF